MKKFFNLFALMFLIGACWNSAGASPKPAGASLKANADVYTYDKDAGIITSVSQLSANSLQSGDGGGLAALIDFANDTFCHTGYTPSLVPDAEHYLQVDISTIPIQKMIFTFTGRSGNSHDTWDDVDIYVTNDTANHDSWKLAQSMKDILPADESGVSYVSPMIDFGQAYNYVRFVVKKTTGGDGRMVTLANGHKYYYWNLAEFQMFQAIKVEDPQTLLKTVVDSINALKLSFPKGTNPGYYPEEKVTNYNDILLAATESIDGGYSDEEYLDLISRLRNTLKDIQNSMVKITDGYYNIVNAYPNFNTTQHLTKSMNANVHEQLGWGTTNVKDPMQLFKVTAITDTTFTVQNVGSGEYANTSTGYSTHVPTSPTFLTPQMIKYVASQQWNISNIYNPRGYHPEGHSSGAGISGLIVNWPGGVNTASVWYLNKIEDQTLIDSLTNVASQSFAATAIKEAVAKAKAARKKTIEYDPLITNAKDKDPGCQFSSNAKEPNEGSFANLIDGKSSTFFHSLWSSTITDVHNLQVDLVKPMQKINFWFKARSGGYHDTPNNMDIYVTNVDTLGQKATSPNDLWKFVRNINDTTIANVSDAEYTSPDFDFGEPYRYFRIVVNGTTSSRGVFFNLSEFQAYDVNVSAKSEYSTVPGMKEACDQLDALVTAGEASIAAGTASVSDTTAIYAATRAVNALYVNRDVMDTEMAALLDSAKDVHAKILATTVGLLTSVDQLSANSIEVGDGGGLAALLDNNTATFCHSAYDTNNGSTLPDADHYLQMDLTTSAVPVDSFYIDFTGRVGGTDSPDSVDIYVTNDASVLAGENDAWTLVKSFSDMIDGNPNPAKFTSGMIQLGGTYKYVRMVIRKTATDRQEDTYKRYFWNMSEFQLYTTLPGDRMQYNYVEGMKDAVDNLKTAIETASKYGTHEIYSEEPIQTLRTAMNNVLALYADSSLLASAYDKYIQIADSSFVGEGLGFVDAQDAIDAFRAAITTAKSSISPTQPTAATIKEASAKMDEAYATFLTHVTQIVPNQWYTIISGSTRASMKNQPIFLGSTSIGYKLMISGYSIETMDVKSDPYCVWRFVPIEGKEGQYAVQSMGTGQYFGAYRGDGADNAPLMSHTKVAYKVNYFGNGKFKLIQASVKNDMDALKTDETNKIVLNYPLNNENQQTWMFNAVSEEQEMSFNVMPDNSIQIMTLPFELKGDNTLAAINEGVKTYKVMSLKVSDTSTQLGLKEQTEFAAGEPFIMTVNDYTLYDPAAESNPISFMVPATVVDTSSIVANGLVGTLQGKTFEKIGLGIFSASKLKITNANSVTSLTSVAGRSGYIDPNQVVNEEGEPDLLIEVNGLMNGTEEIIAKVPGTGNVNVYTTQGQLLKTGVAPADAVKNLNKGIYIVGKKKIAIK